MSVSVIDVAVEISASQRQDQHIPLTIHAGVVSDVPQILKHR
jgi:hypothetical protein